MGSASFDFPSATVGFVGKKWQVEAHRFFTKSLRHYAAMIRPRELLDNPEPRIWERCGTTSLVRENRLDGGYSELP